MALGTIGRSRRQGKRMRKMLSDLSAKYKSSGQGDIAFEASESEMAGTMENPPKEPDFPGMIVAIGLFKDFVLDPADLTIVGIVLVFPIKLIIVITLFLWSFNKIKGTWWKKPLSRWLVTRYVGMAFVEMVPFLDLIPWTTVFILMAHYKDKKAVKLINETLEDVRRDFEKGDFAEVDIKMAGAALRGAEYAGEYAWDEMRPGKNTGYQDDGSEKEYADQPGAPRSNGYRDTGTARPRPTYDERNAGYEERDARESGTRAPMSASDLNTGYMNTDIRERPEVRGANQNANTNYEESRTSGDIRVTEGPEPQGEDAGYSLNDEYAEPLQDASGQQNGYRNDGANIPTNLRNPNDRSIGL